MALRAVAFDLDGTLIDSRRAIVEAFRATLRDRLGIEPSDEEIVATWSLPILDRMRRYSAQDAADLAEEYVRRYAAMHDRLVRPFPGVVEVLDALRRLGYRVAIVTSKRRETTALALSAFGFDRLVDAVVADEDVAHHKPAPDAVLLVARRLGVAPDEMLLVGDSTLDIRAAKAAGARSAAAAWGAADPAALAAERPEYVLARPAALLEVLNQS